MIHWSSARLIKALEKRSVRILAMFVSLLVILPTTGISQPASPGGGGGNPDTPPTPPPGVPFDGRLNLILLIAGIILTIGVLKKLQNKQHSKNL